MNIRVPVGLLFVLAACGQAHGQDRPPIRQFSIETIEQLGTELFRRNLVAAAGSDILANKVPDPEQSGLLGWVTTDDEKGPLVTYITVANGKFSSAYDIRPAESADEALRTSLYRSLSDEELTRFMARQTALRQPVEACAAHYNTVVIRDPETGGWLVYLLAASVDEELMPIGGHYRLSLSVDATRVTQIDALFDTCNAPDIDIGDRAGGAESISVTREFSDRPVETDVFLNRLYGIDINVTTRSGETSWIVRDGLVESVDFDPEAL